MKISVSTQQNNLKSIVDERFGRCNFFYIYDTETKKGEFFENPFKDGNHGVGTKIVEFLANKSVSEIFATEVGEKAAEMLSKLNMKTNIMNKDNTLEGIISNLITN